VDLSRLVIEAIGVRKIGLGRCSRWPEQDRYGACASPIMVLVT
jgi:hypothetical protein